MVSLGMIWLAVMHFFKVTYMNVSSLYLCPISATRNRKFLGNHTPFVVKET